MGKKKAKKDASATRMCGACKNFCSAKSGKGRCERKDKKRSADVKACGDFKVR